MSCNHNFYWVKDWYGDPGIPGGVVDCSHYQCSKCGEEATDLEAELARDTDEARADMAAESKQEFLQELYGDE